MSFTATPPSAVDNFALIIEGLCRAVAARGGGPRALAGPFIVLIWGRLRRMAVRFAALAARVRAGTLPSAAPVGRGTAYRAATSPAGPRLPEGFAWLFRFVPEAPSFGSLLQHLLADPEMKAMVSAAPQMARLLRPLCRMLGVPVSLLPPPPTRRRRSSAAGEAAECRSRARTSLKRTSPKRAAADPPSRPRSVARARPPAAIAPAFSPPAPPLSRR